MRVYPFTHRKKETRQSRAFNASTQAIQDEQVNVRTPFIEAAKWEYLEVYIWSVECKQVINQHTPFKSPKKNLAIILDKIQVENN